MKLAAAVTHLVQMSAKGEAACIPLWQVGCMKQRKAKYILTEIILHVLVKDNPSHTQLWFVFVTIDT